MSDNINHPFYYKQENRRECIEEIHDMLGDEGTICFCIGNVHKYLYRAYDKGSAKNNLLKAKWYTNYARKLDTNGKYSDAICKYEMQIARGKELIE